jgi:hypothetical protein
MSDDKKESAVAVLNVADDRGGCHMPGIGTVTLAGNPYVGIVHGDHAFALPPWVAIEFALSIASYVLSKTSSVDVHIRDKLLASAVALCEALLDLETHEASPEERSAAGCGVGPRPTLQ